MYKLMNNVKSILMDQMTVFPCEFFIELDGISPFLVGRIIISQHGNTFNAEIDIVQNESGKIHNHVNIIYGESDPRETLDLAVHHLKLYLQKKLN